MSQQEREGAFETNKSVYSSQVASTDWLNHKPLAESSVNSLRPLTYPVDQAAEDLVSIVYWLAWLKSKFLESRL